MQKLREYLSAMPPGDLATSNDLVRLLQSCWDDLAGSGDTSMAAYKLARIRDCAWIPPVLSFVIERHGSATLGSIYSEVFRWDIDVETASAGCSLVGRKMIGKRQVNVDVKALARVLMEKVLEAQDDPRLRWSSEKDHVRISANDVVPDSGPTLTVQGRRRRFRNEMRDAMVAAGWEEIPNSTPRLYRRRFPESSPHGP